MKILDDGPADAGAHAFAVELETGDEPDGAQVRELWESAPDGGDYGVPHAVVRCERGKADVTDVRAALRRFNEAPEDGWRWTVDALASHLLHELCGIALMDAATPCPAALRMRPHRPEGGSDRDRHPQGQDRAAGLVAAGDRARAAPRHRPQWPANAAMAPLPEPCQPNPDTPPIRTVAAHDAPGGALAAQAGSGRVARWMRNTATWPRDAAGRGCPPAPVAQRGAAPVA